MADVDELIQQARALGAAIAAHPKVKAYFDAQRAVFSDETARKLLEDYNAAADNLRKLESQRKPIEPADKKRLAECEQALASNETVKSWMRCQADYFEVMTSVNKAMEEALSQAAPRPSQSS